MRLGIMQPYFFPYLGYFSLIKHVDQFILFDTPQFIRHGWIERNRIIKPSEGWQYIAVPLVKHSQKTAINEIKVNNEINWKSKILAQLIHYKKAPNFRNVMELVEEIFKIQYEDIVTLDQRTLEKTCEYLGVEKEILVYSKMNLDIDEVNAPDEWALNICKVMRADEYWNPPGGIDFFDERKYKNAHIDIQFQKINLREYKQGNGVFMPGLSILDVMMYNSPAEISDMLDDFELVKKTEPVSDDN